MRAPRSEMEAAGNTELSVVQRGRGVPLEKIAEHIMTVSPRPLSKQPVVDLVVAMVAVPLLVVFGLMLESNMRGQWTADVNRRWNVLGLGLALLFISLVVCCYATHRLGLCIRPAQQPPPAQPQSAMTSVSSQLHLVSRAELPPSYEAVVAFDIPPPPYCSVLVPEQKQAIG